MQTPISRRSLLTTIGLLTLAGQSPFHLARAQGAGTRLLLLGTQGGPNFNTSRRETGSAILVGDRPYLVDCGYGVLGRLAESGHSYLDIPHVFLTHLHDDHVADIPALIGHQWTQGRIEPTDFWGPHGTEAMVTASLNFNRANTQIRMVDEGRQLEPASLFSGHDVPAQDNPQRIFEDDLISVEAIANTHYPTSGLEHMPHRSVSFRFDTQDRSIVFSGDTTWSDNLVRLARDADVLVCEAMQVDVMERLFADMVASGNYQDNPEGIWQHIVSTHTTTEQAGRMAAEAGVGLLVLNHLIPGGLEEAGDASYLRGVRRHYDGPVIVGRDLQSI